MMLSIVYMMFLIAVMVLTILAFLIYLKVRLISNGFMALASKEFHDSVSSLLETPSELPDGVLDHIEFMIDIGSSKRGHWSLFKAIRLGNRGAFKDNSYKAESLKHIVKKMRPELRELLDEANVAWVNWLINRNVFVGALISLELRRAMVQRGDLSKFSTAASDVPFGWGHHAC